MKGWYVLTKLKMLTGLKMAEHIVAFDDSGGSDRHFPAVAGVTIRKDQYGLFCERWRELCSDIGRDLGVASAPIHARLMYGRTLPPDRNPYAESDGTPKLAFKKTVEYLERAVELFGNFSSQDRVAAIVALTDKQEQLTENLDRYYRDPGHCAEMEFLHRKNKRICQRYRQRLRNVPLSLWVRLVAMFEEFAYVTRLYPVNYILDSFQDSAGIDSDEFLACAREVVQLKHIGSIKVVSNPDHEPLLQFADLLAYITRRSREAREGSLKPDPEMQRLSEKVESEVSGGFPSEEIKEIGARLRSNPDWNVRASALLFALARKELEDLDPDFTDRYLLPVEEFLNRALVQSRKGKEVAGYSILKGSVLRNGEHSAC